MQHLGDITKISGYDIPVVDVITGGSPCQDLSVAGKRAGLDGERSGLFMEQIRIVKEMRERDRRNGRSGWAVRPRFMVWENVPGAFSSNKGKDFQAVLSEIVKIAEPDAPDVPLPESGKWPKAGCLYQNMGGGGQLLGAYTTPSFGESPREENVSRLSQILEDSPHPKYSLSAKVCQGILNRAKRRGKELPTALAVALKKQSVSKNEPVNLGGARESSFSVNTQEPCPPSTTNPSSQSEYVPDKAHALSHRYDGSPQPDKGNGANIVCASFKAGNGSKARGIGYEEEKTPTLSAAESGTNQVPAIAFGISAYESNAMKSSNPHSGIYQAETARTLDLNGGSPACNQGGVAIVHAVDCRNGTENECVNGTLQAKETGQNLNSNNVVRVEKP